MYVKPADQLKVTWYMIRLTKNIWSTKIPRGGEGTGGPKVTEQVREKTPPSEYDVS